MTLDYREAVSQVYDGYTIPVVRHDGYKRLYGEKPYGSWGSFELDFSGCYAIDGTTRLLSSTVRRLLEEPGADFIEAFARMKYIPNGQLKNFLVACRTFYSLGSVARIAVVGSKSHEGSGAWHKYLALFLSEGRTEVSIDFIDQNETEAQWAHKAGDCQINCRWIPDMVTADMLGGYDAVSSDVWTFEEKTSWGRPDVPVYSLKGGHSDYTPYLHYSETRFFTSPPSGFSVKCPCLICQACASCVRNWCSFVFLRTLCARLGCPSRCRGIHWVYDQNSLSTIRQEILTGVGVDRLPSNYRYILALSTEEAIVQGEKSFVRGTKIRRLDPRTSEVNLIRQDVYTGLEGKRIVFVGVNPSVLGTVSCQSVQADTGMASYVKTSDVMFVANVSSWLLSFKSDMVFCPDRPDVVEKVLVDWKWTGHMLSEFYQYVLRQPFPVPQRVSKMEGRDARVMSLSVSRNSFSIVEYNGSNAVYARGNLYVPISSLRTPAYDNRSIYTGVFFSFEDVTKIWSLVKDKSPTFTLDDLVQLKKDFSLLQKRQWAYKKKVKIRVVTPTGTINYEGSCVLDFYKSHGMVLSHSEHKLGMLTPLVSSQYFTI